MYDAFRFDDEGIPQYPYGSRAYYNITFICHYALYQLSLHQKYGRAEGLERFMRVSEWIARNGEEEADSFTFPYRYAVGELRPPWLSALGQGRIISVLTRAAEASGDFSRSSTESAAAVRSPGRRWRRPPRFRGRRDGL